MKSISHLRELILGALLLLIYVKIRQYELLKRYTNNSCFQELYPTPFTIFHNISNKSVTDSNIRPRLCFLWNVIISMKMSNNPEIPFPGVVDFKDSVAVNDPHTLNRSLGTYHLLQENNLSLFYLLPIFCSVGKLSKYSNVIILRKSWAPFMGITADWSPYCLITFVAG